MQTIINKIKKKEIIIKASLLVSFILMGLIIFELILNLPYFNEFFNLWVEPNRIFYLNESSRIYLDDVKLVDFNKIDFHNLYYHQNFKEDFNCSSTKKDNSTFRIIFIGDSLTYGQNIPRNKIFTYLLSKKLNKNNYEIYNFGVIGYNLADIIFLFKYQVLDCRPNLVVYPFSQNDLEGSALSTKFFSPYFKYRYSTNKFHHLKSNYYISQKVINRFTNFFEINRDLDNNQYLRELVEISTKNDIRLLIVNIPKNDNGFSSNNFTRIFYEKYKDEGINYLDLRDQFIEKGFDYKQLRISNDDGHYSFYGHKVVADVLYDHLMESNLLENKNIRETQ